MVRRDDTEKLDALLAAVTEDMLPDDLPQYLHDNRIKVERILIPLLGGKHPIYGKRPPIEWKKYQAQQVTERQLETWFTEGYTAYGVVCGGISNLIVIDFDDVEIQAELIQDYPQLLQTYVVQSGLR